MRCLGFSIPMIVLIIGAYIIGAKYPGLFNRVRHGTMG
jgi:hypothetical protein